MRETDPAAFRAIVHHATSEALTRAQALGFLERSPPTFENKQTEFGDAFVGIVPALIKAGRILLLVTLFLLSSLFFYGLFYIAIMNEYNAAENLYFDYSGMVKHPVENPILPTAHFRHQNQSILDNAPWAVADFFSQHSQWEGYNEDNVPSLLTSDRVLKAGNSYEVGVSLDIPESQINIMSGVFSVLVEILSSDGTMLATSIRSTRIPHETAWISTIRKGVLLAPLLVGASEESRTVAVPSFRYLVESEDMPLRYATVTLLSQANKPIEVMTGSIWIGQELSSLQLLVKEWFFTCYAAGTTALFCAHALIWLAYRAHSDRRKRLSEVEPTSSPNMGSDVASQEDTNEGRSEA